MRSTRECLREIEQGTGLKLSPESQKLWQNSGVIKVNRHGLATNSRKDGEKMKTYTVVEYEQSDFDAVKKRNDKRGIYSNFGGLPRGWFPYNSPE